MSFVRQHKGAIVWSVMLHVAVVTALSIGFRLPRQRTAVAMAPIQGVIVDPKVLERNDDRREEAVRQEQQRRQREERQRREAEQAEQRERTEAEQRRVAEQQARERAAEQERERVAAEKRRQEQSAREQRERQVHEQAEREAAAKREREQAAARRQQQQAEAELAQALAAEEERQSAERAGLLDEYILMIENRIERNWNQPLSVQPGLDCIVNVVQLPSGDVMSATVASCNGDAAVVRSIERAVMDASPLPKPPNPALFERNLRVRFHPDL
jgi:colicin import membrane protein